jgi:D-glycerate 3-kinase
MAYGDTLPRETHGLTDRELAALHAQLCEPFRRELADLQIELLTDALLQRIYLPLAAALAKAASSKAGTLVVGVNGAQGSGKTTLCSLLRVLLESGFGLRVASVSIDDLYKTHAERGRLGRKRHPLFTTRGVPGTHDVEMGLQLLAGLSAPEAGHQVAIPVFDKAIDDRAPRSAWRVVETPVDIVLFEGWCVGASPQAPAALLEPVNALEEAEDPQGIWRGHVNAQLAGGYRRLFAELDLLIMLEIPDMDCVSAWRGLQESKLAAQSRRAKASKLMDKAALHRFIMHYERLTRHMLAELPGRADLVLRLDTSHQIDAVRVNNWPVVFSEQS